MTGKTFVIGATAVAAVAIAILVPPGLAPAQARILGIVLFSLGLWATSAIPAYLTSLIFFSALLIGGLETPEVVFSGFTSAAIWLAVSGFVIGAAITSTGLGTRLARAVSPLLSRNYVMLIAGVMALGALLGFLMPSSTGRAMVLVPLAMAVADGLGLERGSNGRIAVAVTVALSSNLPSFAILPANLPNIVLAGAAERIHGIQLGYADYLLLHYPVLGLLKSVLMVAVVLRFYPAEARPAAPTAALPPDAGARQGQLMAILLAMLVLWATDSLHGVQPAWIGMAAAVLLLMPGIGFVSPQQFRQSVDFGTILMVTGVLAVGTVVNQAGLGEPIAGLVARILPLAPGHDFANFVSLSLLSVVTGLLTTVPGAPAVLTPLAGDLSTATGLPVEVVLMTQVIGFSTVALPYQAPPLIVAMGLAGEPLKALAKVTLAVAGLTLLVLIPLDFLWWKLLGWI
ncbi:SLC13 family permease [Chachezhania sediminis]|uniref:SLC13 family permease n=1 Tax=Chachezhania sediminis TaxID=2599291 RepID=UPI00131A9A86|nr:SLC13 family permease [Chachezhania sediminis]